jgi:predicted transcriptional regulator of viral defense system
MKANSALLILNEWGMRGRYLFTKRDLGLLFDEKGPTLTATLSRLVGQGFLVRLIRDAYAIPLSAQGDPYRLERIATLLRRNSYNYIALESALSEWGLISQIPIDTLTVMTTGRSGEYRTPYGVIEFTHTKLNPVEILARTIERYPHPLRIASEEFAVAQYKRVRRNTDLLDEQLSKGAWVA